ncbi:MAG: glycosyltransferase [Bacteroidales bacterium]|nr:glycosyltransferase [Bacteroidales bacterium]
MRILFYLPDLDRSSAGVLSYVQSYARMMYGKIELHLLTAHTEDEESIEIPCVMHYLSVRYIPKRGTRNEFLRILNEVYPDVYHTNVCWIPTCAMTAIWAKDAGYRVVYTTHGMMEPWIMKRHYWMKKFWALKLFQRKALEIADVLHATSEGERQNLLKLGYNTNVCVIPNCIDISAIVAKEYGNRRHRILYLGRLHEKKGIKHLIDAFELFCNNKHILFVTFMESTLPCELVIAGESDVNTPHYKEELMDYTKMHGLEHKVRFIGGVYGEEKYNLIRESDVLVLPTYSENFGIVVAEALACGTPVITTKGTPWQELETENCGWWTEIGTEPLVNALRDFFGKSDGELETMGRNGRELVERKYSTNVVAEQFVDMYNKLLM